ncbi:MAG: diaminopimelate epimerase [Polyangiaceae bacterium]|jgi:diaminopimelate epimerase
MGASLRFEKYEGLGNDFLLVDAARDTDLTPEQAARLCDRRFGVGADGVILVLPPRVAGCDTRMRVLNADGSIPEMCGNGVRCVALHVAAARAQRGGTVRVETDAGERTCVLDADGMVTVDMGVVRALGDRAVDVDGRSIVLALADAGNPHAILFGTFARGDVEHLGPRVATHAAFPRGTNVEFACVLGDGIDLVVWERGVGITLACGTGACATAAVACEKGLAARGKPVTVRLPGGRLDITVADDGRTTMRGPAHRVFAGVTG